MSPELETLDQLAGGSLPLSVVRSFFEDQAGFEHAVAAMLDAGEVQLVSPDGTAVPSWGWREVLAGDLQQSGYRLTLTPVGGRRIGG